MYSVVLMTALTAGTQSPEWFWRNCAGCYGCHGCWGCHGCSGCWGWSTYHGNLCHGCYGGCHGCFGWYGSYSQYAWYGGYSEFGVYAPTYGCHGVMGCYGCYGCYGGLSCYGAPLPHHGFWREEVVPDQEKKKDGVKIEETPLPKEKKKEKSSEELSRARVIIEVPADARLYIDGQLMKSKSTRRVIQTPDLLPGETYFYDLKVELVRDGRTVVETQKVLLRPGQVSTASFATLGNNAAASAK